MPPAHATHHRIECEGWLNVHVGSKGAAATRKYVVVDGFVLRIFDKEPLGAHAEDTTPAEEIIDLRYVDKMTIGDEFKPPPAGACTLHGKDENSKHKHKELTIEPEAVVGGADAEHCWWLKHVMSALSDHAVAPALRKWRDEATVLALITEYHHQPVAYKHSDKEWRKAIEKEKKAEEKLHAKEEKAAQSGKGAHGGSGKAPAHAASGESIAEKLAKAQAKREQHGAASEAAEADASYVDVSDSTGVAGEHGPPASHHLSAAERAAQRKLVGLGNAHLVSAEQPEKGPQQGEESVQRYALGGGATAVVGAGGKPLGVETAPAVHEKSAAAAASKAKAAAVPAVVAKQESTEELEEVDEAAERLSKAAVGQGEWWFVKDGEGKIDGPFSNNEMKKTYQKGLVHETTYVHFLPLWEEKEPPTCAYVGDSMFAVLEECCTASGPPFME